MSFDVFVYFDEPPADLGRRWERALADHGLSAQLFEDPDWREIGLFTICPELPADHPDAPGFFAPEEGLQVEIGKFDRDDLVVDFDSLPAALREKLLACRYEASLSTSGGRSPGAMRWQVFTAASLMEATEGVLHDPQSTADHEPELVDFARADTGIAAGLYFRPSDAYRFAAVCAREKL